MLLEGLFVCRLAMAPSSLMEHIGPTLRKLAEAHALDISVSSQKRKQIQVVELVRRQRAERAQELVFSARPFVLCGMPLKRPPPDNLVHRRRNGRFFLQIHGHPDYGLPFGQDRLVIIWAATQAIRQKSRIIEFETATEILEMFGLNRNGKSFRRLTAGFKRVFGSTIYFGIGTESSGREVFDCARFCFFDRMRLWTSRVESIEPACANTPNRVELSEKFWAEIQAHPIPGELHTVRGFANSPGCMDFYLWLTWRCHGLRREEHIALFGDTGLQAQLGSEEYTRSRDFRRIVERWLSAVRVYWPDCPAFLAANSDNLRIRPASVIGG